MSFCIGKASKLMKKQKIIVNNKKINVGIINPHCKQTIILIHGLGSSYMTLEKLAKEINIRGYRVIVFDLPGHHLSDKLDTKHNIKNYSLFLNDLIQELKIDKCSILGHCLGAQIAISYENLFPNKVNKLVLITPIPSRVYASGVFASLYYLIALALPKPLKRSWLVNMRQIIKKFAYMKDDDEMKALVDKMTKKEIKHLNADVITQGFKSIMYDKSKKIIAQTQAQTYIIISEKDFVFPAKEIVRLYKKIPRVKFDILPKEGHLLVLDSPKKVATKINKWHSGSS